MKLSIKLKNRHIQMIAIGGAIGTGLFFGAAKSLQLTGPSIILSYLLGGMVMYIIMRALGEMTVHEPHSGAFSHYAYQYVGDYLGFISGWFAWFEYTIVCMLEITAVAVFLDYWIPGVSHWITISCILGIFFIINLISVGLFGEFEFWFAGIKVVTIVLMIVFSMYLVFLNHSTELAAHNNIHDTLHGVIFANGWKGFLFSMVLVIFSFGGAQFLAIAAADADEPASSVPKAINGVVVRIIIFYVGTFVAILSLFSWQRLDANTSPFVDVFDKVGFHFTAQIMSIVIITAALSAFNSCLYAATRMLANLAWHNSAPSILGHVNNKNIPKNALIATSIVIVIAVLINYLFPEQAIIYLIAITTTSIIITWTTILICHFGFKRSHPNLVYKLPFFPYANYLGLFVLLSVVAIMLFMDDMKVAVYLMPVWIAIISLMYLIYKKQNVIKNTDIN